MKKMEIDFQDSMPFVFHIISTLTSNQAFLNFQSIFENFVKDQLYQPQILLLFLVNLILLKNSLNL